MEQLLDESPIHSEGEAEGLESYGKGEESEEEVSF